MCGALPRKFYQYNDAGLLLILTMPLDLTVSPLYRLNGQDQPSLPGLMAAVPPRRAARGREQDRLIVYLLLAGNAVFSTGEYVQLASRAAVAFYEAPGALTSALRYAAESVNRPLLDRNMSTSNRGQYAVGWLVLAALRETQATLLLSGPMHVFVLGAGATQHVHDSLSGKGVGLSQNPPSYFSQVVLHDGDRLVFCGRLPEAWEPALADPNPASFDATRRRLLTLTSEDVNAVLLQTKEGPGNLTILRPGAESAPAAAPQTAPMPASAASQPSAYAIPLQPREETPAPAPGLETGLLSSLPRARPTGTVEAAPPPIPELEPDAPAGPPPGARRAARLLASGFQNWRQFTARAAAGLEKFLPRLLPGADDASFSLSSTTMAVIALLIPLVVVTVASMVYVRFGRTAQFDEALIQAQQARQLAVGQSDPVAQREAWQRVLTYADLAESYDRSDEIDILRQEAHTHLDTLLGVTRLQFTPAFSIRLGIQISRMAASEGDLYMLDAQRGKIVHAALTSGGFEEDTGFNCSPGTYGNYTVGPLVDILTLPRVNTVDATVLGVDAAGNLLYCAPRQVAQALALPAPDTNWGRVTAFTIEAGDLYVLDAPSRAVWVYNGKDGAFVDRPYFFFGGQIPDLQDTIDLAVSGDELFLLHADGHLSTCFYSRLDAVPTRCEAAAALTNPFPAYRDVDLFAQSHFTQMLITSAPDLSLLLLDADAQSVFRFASRSLELQNQLQPVASRTGTLPNAPIDAITVSPNRVLFLAVGDQVYFATDAP
jgi:hypothetical protein